MPSTESSYFEVFPKLLPAGEAGTIHIRPLGWHCAFAQGEHYAVTVRPLLECDDHNRDRLFDYIAAPDVTPDADGGITFTHRFDGEQEHYIRVYRLPLSHEAKNEKLVQLSVYSLLPDLYALKPLRGDLHVHTRCSDGHEAPAIVAANYRRAGFDFMSITDHRKYYPSLEAINAYKDIPTGLKIFKGEEVHAPGNHVHIINFAGEISANEAFEADEEKYMREVSEIESSLPELGAGVDRFVYASCKWVYDKIRQGGGLAIFAHPFWRNDVYNVSEAMTRAQFKNRIFDAFELLNGMPQRTNNLQTAFWQQMRAEGIDVPIVGSSDSHGTINAQWFKWLSTIVFARSASREDICEAVMSHRSVAVEQFEGEYNRAFGDFRYVKYALFLLEDYFPIHDELCVEEGRLMKEAALGSARAAELLGEVCTRADEYYIRCIKG